MGDNPIVTIPKLEIEFDGQNYTMPAESLLSQEYEFCELNIHLDNGDLPSDWIIVGQTFFKDFVLSVDYDNNLYSIGLSKNAHYGAEVNGQGLPKPEKGSSGLAWWWILIIVIVGLLLLLIILYVVYRCIKKGNDDTVDDDSENPYAKVNHNDKSGSDA